MLVVFSLRNASLNQYFELLTVPQVKASDARQEKYGRPKLRTETPWICYCKSTQTRIEPRTSNIITTRRRVWLHDGRGQDILALLAVFKSLVGLDPEGNEVTPRRIKALALIKCFLLAKHEAIPNTQRDICQEFKDPVLLPRYVVRLLCCPIKSVVSFVLKTADYRMGTHV